MLDTQKCSAKVWQLDVYDLKLWTSAVGEMHVYI